ncbi:hypothetical protein EsH8_IV_001095 [Colletotrichum jinshuiense]
MEHLAAGRGKLVSLDMVMSENDERNKAQQDHELERSQSFDVDPIKKRESDPAPMGPGAQLSRSPSWLRSPGQTPDHTRSRLTVMQNKRAPRMKDSSEQGPTVASFGPEAVAPSESVESLHSATSSSQLAQGQPEQYGSPKSEPDIQWPKLKKVTKQTAVEAGKEPLPWLKRPLRRVQKEDNMSQQAQERKLTDVESWRSQLRKVPALDTGSSEERRDSDPHHGDRKRADTCMSCRHETPPPSPPFVREVGTSSGFGMRSADDVDSAMQEVHRGTHSNQPRQKRLEEVRVSTSQRSSSRTSTTMKVESEAVTQVSRTIEATHATSKTLAAIETGLNRTAQDTQEPSYKSHNEVEVFSPLPIMPPNHACSWKERYLNLTAEVRQLKAEIVSRERHDTPGLVDVGVNVNQDNEDELGVEGLTIVMHLKGKDDLIINTDLTQVSSDV